MGFYYSVTGEMKIKDAKNLERAKEIILDAFREWRKTVVFFPRKKTSIVDVDVDSHEEHRYDGAEEDALRRIRDEGLLLEEDDYVLFEAFGEDGSRSLIRLEADGSIVETLGEPIWEVSSEDLAAELARRGDLDDAFVRHGVSVKLLHKTVRIRFAQNGIEIIADPVPSSGVSVRVDDPVGKVRVMAWRDKDAVEPTDIVEIGEGGEDE